MAHRRVAYRGSEWQVTSEQIGADRFTFHVTSQTPLLSGAQPERSKNPTFDQNGHNMQVGQTVAKWHDLQYVMTKMLHRPWVGKVAALLVRTACAALSRVHCCIQVHWCGNWCANDSGAAQLTVDCCHATGTLFQYPRQVAKRSHSFHNVTLPVRMC